MSGDFWIIGCVALGAALASPIGGLLSLFLPASTLFLSIAVGFAGGLLLGTLSFEMIPTALETIPVAAVIPAVLIGVALTFGLDLFVNRGQAGWRQGRPEPRSGAFPPPAPALRHAVDGSRGGNRQ